MSMAKGGIERAQDLSGKASFGPYHYAQALGIDWHKARDLLRQQVELGRLIALKNGTYRPMNRPSTRMKP